jgi:hypothetical protein
MSNMASHLNGGGAAFSSDLLALMEDAYRRACNSITAPLSVKKLIAEKILELTKGGELDPHILCREALASWHIDGKCE